MNCENQSARAVDLGPTLRVVPRAHSPSNNRPERNENCVTYVVGLKCYLCRRLLRSNERSSFETGEGFSPQTLTPCTETDPSSGGLRPPPSPTRGHKGEKGRGAHPSSLRGAKRRSNPCFSARGQMDCFAALAMTNTTAAPAAYRRRRLRPCRAPAPG